MNLPIAHPGASADAPPVDLGVLPALTGCEDPDMLAEFLSDFREIARQAEAEMLDAAQTGDLNAMRHVAHRVKSSARYVGALQLGELSDTLETACEKLQADATPGLLAQWRREWARVDAFLGSRG